MVKHQLITRRHTLAPVTVETLTCDRPFVILAPHPDDDILGAAALMHQAMQRGIDFAVVFLTNGGASHHHPQWPADRTDEARCAEARMTLWRLLGTEVPTLFCDLPDGDLADTWHAETLHQIAVFCRSYRAHTLIVTDPADHHGDHKAAFGIASLLWHGGAVDALWTMPVGTRLSGAEPDAPYRALRIGDDEALRKHAAIDTHGTRRGLAPLPDSGFLLTDAALAPFLHREVFRPVAGVDEGDQALREAMDALAGQLDGLTAVTLTNGLAADGVITGEMAAEAAIALARLRGWRLTQHDRGTDVRFDRLEPPAQ